MRQVQICEVGPRDGLQNARQLMPTETKKAWISALAAAGLNEIEVGSFVPPKLIPAMADTAEVVDFALSIEGLKVVALAPNVKGFERAVASRAHKVTFPVSASRAHSLANVRMEPEKMVEEVRKCVQLRGKSGPEWFEVREANVSYDHPYDLPLEHALNIDFVNEALGPGARVAVELSVEAARQLVKTIEAVLAKAEERGVLEDIRVVAQ